MLNLFLLYFVYHGLFFAVFSAQNYYYYADNQFQICFLILVIFYLRFIVHYILALRNKSDMRRMGKWLRPRLYLKILEHLLLVISITLVPFYL